MCLSILCISFCNFSFEFPYQVFVYLICNWILIWCHQIPDSVGAISNVRSFIERPTMVPMYNATWPTSNTLHVQGLTVGGKLISSPIKQKGTLISCVKTPETAGTAKCDGQYIPHLEKR